MCSWYSEVDSAIGRHGEPHVVRVSVVCILIPRVNEQILFISVGSYLSKDLQVMIRSVVTCATIHPGMNKHLPSS